MSMARSSDVMDSSRHTGVFEPALQLGMPNEVVPRQRLLDHHQIQRVERGQAIDVVERVGVVRVSHEGSVRAELLSRARARTRRPSRA
jgi:hypothetical protein